MFKRKTVAMLLGSGLMLVGFGFKVAMFPFYMWVPDTYEAAPTPLVAFLSVAPKVAGIAALFRLYFELFQVHVAEVTTWVAVLAAARIEERPEATYLDRVGAAVGAAAGEVMRGLGPLALSGAPADEKKDEAAKPAAS